MSRVSIETTQNVQIDYELASIGDRILAFLIDFIIIVAYLIATSFLLFYFIESLSRIRLYWPLRVFMQLIPVMCYTLLCEIFMNGQTIGKRQRKIKVLCLDGSQPTLSNYLIRWLLRPIDIYFTFGAAAIVTMAANGRSQRLADIAAGTTVVKVKPKVQLADLRRLFLNPINNYQPVYEQALMLSDNDINIIKDILAKRNKIRDRKIFDSLVKKIKDTLNITYEGAPIPFLQTIVKDYNFLANQETE
ncbi:MAG TPA: RDD family protein [Microscillaceae bacterium]|nr:RDD family protein [Microscillaceae bacterium]